MRKRVSRGSPCEPRIGMSRAVRAGSMVTVAGTTPLGPDGRTVGRGDPTAQARRCLEIIEAAGASLRHVVRTRILLTRTGDRETAAAVHGEFFREIRPANTVRPVSPFIDPDGLLEIEADSGVEDPAEPAAEAVAAGTLRGQPRGRAWPRIPSIPSSQG